MAPATVLIRSTGTILVVVVVVLVVLVLVVVVVLVVMVVVAVALVVPVVDSCSLHNMSCLSDIEIRRNMSIGVRINMNWKHFGLCVPER